jgi:integration host factor subunit beta
MTKSELVARLAQRNRQLLMKDAEFVVKVIEGAIGQALKDGGRVEIRGFGSFKLSYRPARVARNPKSGERVLVPAKHLPHFRAGKDLGKRVAVPGAGSAPHA